MVKLKSDIKMGDSKRDEGRSSRRFHGMFEDPRAGEALEK